MQVVEGRARIDDVRAFVETLGEIGEDHGCVVQPLDARYVVDRAHLERAVELAERARERGEAIADDPAVEVLLYAAGRRQIDRALEMGVGEGECPVVVVVLERGAGDSMDAERAAAEAVADLLDPAETLGNYDVDRVRAFFDVGDRELAATDAGLPALVRERVALLPVEK
jgi:KEOPS complex subunit Cgi121